MRDSGSHYPFRNEPPATGRSTFQFDTGGGTRHVTPSLATVFRHAPSGNACAA